MTKPVIQRLAERIAERLCAHVSSPTQLASCIEHRTKQIVAELTAVGELVEAVEEMRSLDTDGRYLVIAEVDPALVATIRRACEALTRVQGKE